MTLCCRLFPSVEEQSYTLLNFVNYQRNELEAVRRQNAQVSVICVCLCWRWRERRIGINITAVTRRLSLCLGLKALQWERDPCGWRAEAAGAGSSSSADTCCQTRGYQATAGSVSATSSAQGKAPRSAQRRYSIERCCITLFNVFT